MSDLGVGLKALDLASKKSGGQYNLNCLTPPQIRKEKEAAEPANCTYSIVFVEVRVWRILGFGKYQKPQELLWILGLG